ncbi:hypothetical protein EDEG_02487 [Edhazardia aedis USNM 41457]|uniref:Trafficking protein particle complex subunit n=1 Tax=Edhazardia aedis (strain USNM 41457) TaxID=1003232 RepID=J8ZU02_EDHAE|nr:hypothetical protein EDEG_02487 [Edhazardia aedis USNM 41457]|eukprot:EJW03128.1 hypothetical protein EDEG_02487 [Edhazardia aedis USNM 41457]
MNIANLLIINKSGGLIFTMKNDKSSNQYMIISSSLHTIYAHTQEIKNFQNQYDFEPLIIYAQNHKITFYRTLTGYSFIFISDKDTIIWIKMFEAVYKVFIDYVLKNPFYCDEMPVNNDKFYFNLKNTLDKMK